MTTARVRRGRESEAAVAAYLRENGWPDAQRIEASLPGADIKNTPDLAFEVKSAREWNVLDWIRQAWTHGGLPIVVYRPDKYGPQTVSQWPAIVPLRVLVQLLIEAGYAPEGEPKDDVTVTNDSASAGTLRSGPAPRSPGRVDINQVPLPPGSYRECKCEHGQECVQMSRLRRQGHRDLSADGEGGLGL